MQDALRAGERDCRRHGFSEVGRPCSWPRSAWSACPRCRVSPHPCLLRRRYSNTARSPRACSSSRTSCSSSGAWPWHRRDGILPAPLRVCSVPNGPPKKTAAASARGCHRSAGHKFSYCIFTILLKFFGKDTKFQRFFTIFAPSL